MYNTGLTKIALQYVVKLLLYFSSDSPSGLQEVILPEWCSECEEIGDRKIGDITTPQYCRRANELDGFIYLSTNLSLSSCCFILFQPSLHPIIVGQY